MLSVYLMIHLDWVSHETTVLDTSSCLQTALYISAEEYTVDCDMESLYFYNWLCHHLILSP